MLTAERFKDLLLPGETIVWSDIPGQGVIFAARDALLIPFSLAWGGFAIFWEITVLSAPKTPGPFALFGLPFVLVGLFLIFGRFFLDAWLRGRTAYALTDRRILIRRWGPWPSFKAVRLDQLPEATLSEGSGGRGTIRFGGQVPIWSRSGGFAVWVPSLDTAPQFFAIVDAKRVFALVQKQAFPVKDAGRPAPR